MTVGQTVKSWSLMETVLSVTGLVVVLILGVFISWGTTVLSSMTSGHATTTGRRDQACRGAWAVGEIIEADRDKRVEHLQMAQTLDEIPMLTHDLQTSARKHWRRTPPGTPPDPRRQLRTTRPDGGHVLRGLEQVTASRRGRSRRPSS